MSTRARVSMVVGGVVAVTAYAALAAIVILVWEPAAAAPELSLAEIHAAMDAASESPGILPAAIILGAGVALAVLLATLLARRPDATATTVIVAFLGMLVLGAPAYFIAGFGPGMALADTFLISGADRTDAAVVPYLVSIVALCGLAAAIITSVVRRPATAPVRV